MQTGKRLVSLIGVLALLLSLLVSFAQVEAASGPEVVVLSVKGTINPALSRYVTRGINAAGKRQADLVVIQLDTPGGLDEAMREIIQDIVNAPLPVAVYVAPAGARAASAGTFITIAAHIAAMSPGTEIGAAHPVALGQSGQGDSVLEGKVLNDAVAYITSLAELRSRNIDWAGKAVRESASVHASEAQALGVVDLVVPDLPSLLQAIDGRTVELLDKRQVTLETSSARVTYVNMSLAEDFLFTISNPNVAFILLSLAMLALFFELANPGAIFPGVIGAILLLLSLFSLGTLPINWAGFLLVVLAFAMFALEVFVTSHGILGLGAIVALVLGGMLLISSGAPPSLRVHPGLIAGVAAGTAAYFIFVVQAVYRSRKQPKVTGYEELIGQTAVVRTPLAPRGMVFFRGERWEAEVDQGRVEAGESVEVVGVLGLKLRVVKR
ncbi:MAG: nodulation protein NfeD [Chloroflexi bacterium]|nr:nodulation protein NfeD [Chloroflexota bacterium]